MACKLMLGDFCDGPSSKGDEGRDTRPLTERSEQQIPGYHAVGHGVQANICGGKRMGDTGDHLP